jgi:predicted dehydrogenase
LQDCHLKLMCDTSEQRLAHLKSLYPGLEGHKEYGHLLNGAGLDAIVIATPVRFHHAMAKASLLAGKHTFIEKPMASSSAECEELVRMAEERGLVLMVGHTFLYSAAVRKIKEIVDRGDIGDIRYISARRLNLGLFQKDSNVAWDLAPHDISIILHILEELPVSVNCRGEAHITPGIEDVTNIRLTFRKHRSALIESSRLDPRKVRAMTIVGSERMIAYDDVAPIEKIKVFNARASAPPLADSFAELQYSYDYGDVYVPYLPRENPLKLECQHFLDCIRNGWTPLTNGRRGLEVVRILEAASASLKRDGAAIEIQRHGLTPRTNAPVARMVREPERICA